MSIRTNKNSKNRLREIPVELQVVPSSQTRHAGPQLKFRTQHKTKPTIVDLTVFATGQEKPVGSGTLRNGPFRGRPELIEQLAPAIEDHLIPLAAKSVEQHLQALRSWWRLLDTIEMESPLMERVTSVAQLSELHRQRAIDSGMSRLPFGNFLIHVNNTRHALGLKPFVWQRPRHSLGRERKLPPTWQTDMVRRELKHGWFAVVDRWELADSLMATQKTLVDNSFSKVTDEQNILLKGYLRLERAIKETGHPRPAAIHLRDPSEVGKIDYYSDGVYLMDILRGRYPDSSDIRMAFHLCLATTGWNPAVLLALDVNNPFIEIHPRSPSRYILRGTKDRASGAEQVSEGLLKSQGSAGFILRTLVERTAPLRTELVKIRTTILGKLNEGSSLSNDETVQLQKKVDELSQGIRSPWLFVSNVGDGIHWLTDFNFAINKQRSFLRNVIANINIRQPKDRQLTPLVPGDLRDAYAAKVYHASAGSILAVMKALNHKSLSSTKAYLDNTLLNEEHRKLFGIFSNAFWDELNNNGRIDPTILAKISRDGLASQEQRGRLESYRNLIKSRMGIGCRQPTNPPRHIAPNFVADGKKLCPVQRCLLCLEHAVLLPESLDGLCKRASELEFIRKGMSIVAWQQSSFAEEFENIELALSLFDLKSSTALRKDWTDRVNAGTHLVPEFNGVAEEI